MIRVVRESELRESLTAASPDPPTGLVAVALPSVDFTPPVGSDMPEGGFHVTLAYYGPAVDVGGDTIDALKEWVDEINPIEVEARVGGVARMGYDEPQAVALLLEDPGFNDLRSDLREIAMPDTTHPHFTPHMTIGYGIALPDVLPASVYLDRVELWIAGEHYPSTEDTNAVE